MNFLDLRISIVWLFVSFIVLPFAGFIFRGAQLQKKQRRIKELEEEMVNNHAEILTLQEQLAGSKKSEFNAVAVKEKGLVVESASKTKLKVSSM
jgi:hypothetical protein